MYAKDLGWRKAVLKLVAAWTDGDAHPDCFPKTDCLNLQHCRLHKASPMTDTLSVDRNAWWEGGRCHHSNRQPAGEKRGQGNSNDTEQMQEEEEAKEAKQEETKVQQRRSDRFTQLDAVAARATTWTSRSARDQRCRVQPQG